MKPTPTPIRSYTFVHKTKRFYIVLASITVWTLLTTSLTVLAVNSKYFHNQYQCETTQIAPIKTLTEPTKPSKIVNRISEVYNIPKAKAYEIVGVVKSYTRQGWPDYKTALAIIATESAFKHDAVSSANAKGYMQVLKASGKPVTTEIYQNIQSGTSLLREYHKELGSPSAAIQAYNIGITSYKKGMRAPEYHSKVQKNLKMLNLESI